jgi:hypothetical protein
VEVFKRYRNGTQQFFSLAELKIHRLINEKLREGGEGK